ncbi:MAG TPA: sugar ABC transporter substrate-binding protein, partial [Candidatus Kapabacteria bacterium]
FIDGKDSIQQDIVEPFMKEHPGIEVDVEAIPYGLYTAKIEASAAGGNSIGDVVLIDDWFSPDLFKRNYTIPLDSFYHRDLHDSDFFTQFFPVWRKGNSPTGPLMAMPASGGVTALFYNRDLFDKAHISYPDSTWTYATMLDAAQKLTNNATDPAQNTWGMIVDDGGFPGVDTYIYSNGGKILSDDNTKSEMTTPATESAVQTWVDLVQKYHVAPPPDPSVNLGQQFMLGHAAMMMHIDYAKTELANATFRWDLTAPPKGTAGLLDRENGMAFGIAKTCSQPDSAWELIKWIVTLPTKKGVSSLYFSGLPLYKPLAYSSEYLDAVPKCNRHALLDLIQSSHLFTLVSLGWQEWRDHGFIPNMDDMLAGRESVPAGCAAIAQKMNDVLSRNRP